MAGLTQAQLDQLDEQGYVVVDNVLDPEEDLAPVIAEYADVLDGIARDLHAEGVLASTYADLPFDQRLIQVCDESGQIFTQALRHLTAAESRGSRRCPCTRARPSSICS